MLINPTLGASTVKTTSYYLHRSEDSTLPKARKSPSLLDRKGLTTRLLKETREELIAELKATRLSIRCSTLACCPSWSCEGETLPCKQLQGYVGVPFLGVLQFFELVDVGKGIESSLPAHRGYWRPQLSPHLWIRTDTQLIQCFELEIGPFTQSESCIYKKHSGTNKNSSRHVFKTCRFAGLHGQQCRKWLKGLHQTKYTIKN